MNKALKKALSIGVILTLMLCCFISSPEKIYAAYVDGTYGVGVSCTGGSGRGGVASASVTVSGGNIVGVTLTMTSGNYDYAYDPVTGGRISNVGGGNSAFWINYPGTYFNFTTDTTAMTQAHEITYTISLDISGVPVAGSGGGGGGYTPAPSGPSAEEIARQEREKRIKEVDAVIEKIGDPKEVTLDSEEAITAAREAVDAMAEDERKDLTKIADLEAAEAALKAIEEKIEGVDKLIEDIGEVTLESEDAIKAAREAADGLTPKEMVRLTKLGVLKDAENTLEDLKIAAAEAAAKAARQKKIMMIAGAGVVAVILIVLMVVAIRNKKKGKNNE